MTSPTQGEHAQTALAHAAGLESFSESLPAYGFNPQPLKDAAATIRRLHAQVAALTAQPAAPQGVAYAELPKDVIRAVFIENGFTVKEGQTDLKQYVYDAANELLRRARLRASNGQAPAGATDEQRELLEDAAFLLRKYRRLCVEIGRGDSRHLDRIEAAAVAVRALYAEPTSTAQATPAAGAVAGPQFELDGVIAECEHGLPFDATSLATLKRVRDLIAAAPTPAAKADDVGAWAVRVEKLLCEKLGRPWSAEGISINELIDELAAQADSVLEDAALVFTATHIDYVARFGGRCRDCADGSGVCPGSGLPCADSRKAIKHVFDALEYGVKHGYIKSPAAARKQGGA